MDPEDTAPPEGMCESAGGMMRPGRRGRPTIGSARRRELMHFAEQIAASVEEETKPHERCLLRGMVESLIGGDV